MSAASPQTTTPQVEGFFDKATWTVTYVVHQGPGSACAIIDSVLDYDPKSGRTRTTSADKVIEFVKTHQLSVEWILETHAHADHLSAAPYLKKHLGGQIAIGDQITRVQKSVQGRLQPRAAIQVGRLTVRPPACRRAVVCSGLAQRQGDVSARPYTGLRRLPVWGCCFCGRHPVHARCGHGPLRLSRR